MSLVASPSNVSVIVVSFNTRERLRHCLSCIEAEHEVIIVDNASTDGSVDMVRAEFPVAILIPNAENRGFGVANNQGMDVATRELVLLLNSDCYADPGAIERLASVFPDPSIVAAGGMLLNADGSLQETLARPLNLAFVAREQMLFGRSVGGRQNWYTAILRSSLERRANWPNVVSPVPQVMGACIMLRPVERFDPRFFLYVEDTDLCLRLSGHGKIAWYPAARFTHDLGSSSAGASRWLAVARYNWGKELYFSIHHGSGQALACLLFNRLGALLRLLIWTLPTVATLGTVAKFRQKAFLFLRVLTVPLRERRPPPRSAG